LIKFILNNKYIESHLPASLPLLDFIRYQQNLMGTKIGCREGDCGACTVLTGEYKNNNLYYQSCTSCLTPLGNVHMKHVLTVEGTNMEVLNPVQQAMADESATQCGFCTPGIVMSLTGFCLSSKEPTHENAIAAVDGNICRCTGYKSIEKAAAKVASLLVQRNQEEPVEFAVKHHILPGYLASIKERLKNLLLQANGYSFSDANDVQFVGGGTDLYVQKHDEIQQSANRYLLDNPDLKGIYRDGNKCVIRASVTASEMGESVIINEIFPDFGQYLRLISSTPIRNIATVAGNFVNASPIGDFTIMFLALNATVVMSDGYRSRELSLQKFYRGYKTLYKQPEEYIERIWFTIPGKDTSFNFEKVSKRTHLDIASVNSALSITLENGVIKDAAISAGGVGPIPLFLERTSSFLQGKAVDEKLIFQVTELAQEEISPISDVRGSETYKRLLLNQLIKAHFIKLFPHLEFLPLNMKNT
jgi:xanthine dehydrogenase small subunit